MRVYPVYSVNTNNNKTPNEELQKIFNKNPGDVFNVLLSGSKISFDIIVSQRNMTLISNVFKDNIDICIDELVFCDDDGKQIMKYMCSKVTPQTARVNIDQSGMTYIISTSGWVNDCKIL